MKRLSFISLACVLILSLALIPISTFAAAPTADHVIDFSKESVVNSLTNITRAAFLHDTDELSTGSLNIMATGNDPYAILNTKTMFSSTGGIDGNQYQWIVVNIKNLSNADYFELHYAIDDGSFTKATTTQFPIDKNSDTWKTYIAHLPTANLEGAARANMFTKARPSTWKTGKITSLRLDAMYSPSGIGLGDEMFIEYIAFYPTKAAAQAAASGATIALDDKMPNLAPPYSAAIIDFTKEETISRLHSKSNLNYSYDTTISPEGSVKWEATNTDCRAYVDTTLFNNTPVNFEYHKWVAVTIYNDSPADTFEWYMTSTSDPIPVAAKHRLTASIEPNKAEWKTYVFNIEDANLVGGNLTESVFKNGYLIELRIDALLSSGTPIKAGDTMYIKKIGIYASEDEAYGRAPETTVPDTTATTTAPDGTTTAPTTFDPIALVVSGAALSLSSYAIFRKKRER
ncbi:MAG: hypothetical protein GX303_01220 [Clostridiales bacterium]|nr:hypothetical protein [Clostridiales bacterium]